MSGTNGGIPIHATRGETRRLSASQDAIVATLNGGPPASKKILIAGNAATTRAFDPRLEKYIQEAINVALKPVIKDNAEMKKQIETLTTELETVKAITEENNNLNTQLNALRTEIEALKSNEVEMKETPTEMPNIAEELQKIRTEVEEKLTAENKNKELAQDCEAERHEMYSRRDSVRFFNVSEDIKATTEQIVIEACKEMGVMITEKDISTSHRIGRRDGDRPRTIICKFVRRETKYEVLRKRQGLSYSNNWHRVRIHEDLTRSRNKLVRHLIDSKARFTTTDGRFDLISGTKKITIDSLLELTSKLSWSDKNVKGLLTSTYPVTSQTANQ